MMWWQYLIFTLVGLIGLIIIIDMVLGAIVMNKLSKPAKRDNTELYRYESEEKKFNDEWLKVPFEKLQMDSDFGYKLFARLYMADVPTNDYVVVLHGHNSSSLSQLKYLSIFKGLGFNVFMPDHRRSGYSSGETITFGSYEKLDTIQWINRLKEEHPEATFGIFGESMGAATATMVTSMDDRMRFLIEYCGYADFKNLVVPRVKSVAVYYLFNPALRLMARFIGGFRISQTNAKKAMQKVKVPTLILHSKSDDIVNVSSAYEFKKANPSAEIVLFDNAPHARSYLLYEHTYRSAIESFIIGNGMQAIPISQDKGTVQDK